jgi:hypothetical protein
MKYTRQILMALFCISLSVSALAADVTKNNATKVAKNYFSEVLTSNGLTRAAAISETFDIQKDGNTVLYVFNFENGGYVIVSADDRFTPIVGYSPDGFYEKDNMPEGFEFLMEEFSDMIAFIRENDIAAEPEYTTKWERYESDQPTRGIAGTPIIGPLTALWDQGSPYNYYCPVAPGGGPGGKAWAGCVATAMSIIMYYWHWPWEGTGEKTYTPKTNDTKSPCYQYPFPELYANFGEAYYDFNGMYGTPTMKASDYLYEPIAWLQYHAGISVSMMYCGDGSGAYSNDVPGAMRNFFKYDPSIKHVTRQSYSSTAAWTAMMTEQLDLYHPVYTSGQSPKGGHAFVGDGYDIDEMIHYNFGWDGSGNGYFVSDKPDEYTSSVAAVINFIPDRSKGYPIDCNKDWVIPHLKGMLADCSAPNEKYLSGITATWLLDPSSVGNAVESFAITCNEMDLDLGDYLRFYDVEDDNNLLGEFSGKTPFEKITSKGGKVLVKFTSSVSSATGKGFLITYEATPKQYCDPSNPITFTEPVGTFTDGSPDDMNYSGAASCRWYIAPEGATDPETEITIVFNRLNTEEKNDAIKIYDADKNKLIETLSGAYETSDLPIISIKTKKVMITFATNSYINDKGFEIAYFTTPVSINEIENINDLSIYPNPATDKLNVKFNTSTADNFDITMYNVTGQAVYKETLPNFMGSYSNELNINDFAQGVYLMQIKSSKGAITRKVVIQ